MVLEKTFESPLDCKEFKPVNPKGNQSWIFIGRTDAEAEAPIHWPPDAKSWLIGKDSKEKYVKNILLNILQNYGLLGIDLDQEKRFPICSSKQNSEYVTATPSGFHLKSNHN